VKKSLSRKIIFSYILVIFMLFLVSASSLVNMKFMQEQSDEIVKDIIPLRKASYDVLIAMVNQETGFRGYVATGEENFLEPYLLGQQQANENLEEMKNYVSKYPELEGNIQKLEQGVTNIEQFFADKIELVKIGQIQQAKNDLGDGKAHFDSFRATNTLMNETIHALTIRASDDSENAQQVGYISIAISFALSIVITIVLALYFIRSISIPVKKVTEALVHISNGELNMSAISVKNKDEIGTMVNALNKMVYDLKTLVTQAKQVSTQVASASSKLSTSAEETSRATEQIAQSTEQMAIGAETQLESVQQTVDSVELMSNEIELVRTNGEAMLQLSNHASKTSNEGQKTVESVVQQMNQINKTVKDTSTIIEKLGDRSQEIGNFVNTITEIANQTNLLALNAAIEAARAGEQGRGFAIVADEVRKLAEQTSGSASEITELISSIVRETQEAVTSMNNGRNTVKDGISKTEEVREAFSNIRISIQDVAGKVQDVSQAVENIYTSSTSISHSMERVSKAAEDGAAETQQNAASSEEQTAAIQEISASAQVLLELANQLDQSLQKFQIE